MMMKITVQQVLNQISLKDLQKQLDKEDTPRNASTNMPPLVKKTSNVGENPKQVTKQTNYGKWLRLDAKLQHTSLYKSYQQQHPGQQTIGYSNLRTTHFKNSEILDEINHYLYDRDHENTRLSPREEKRQQQQVQRNQRLYQTLKIEGLRSGQGPSQVNKVVNNPQYQSAAQKSSFIMNQHDDLSRKLVEIL